MSRKNSATSQSSSIVHSEHDNTRNVLVILLGWNGANPRHLSKYNKLYDNYEDYIDNQNKIHNKEETPDRVHMIIKQYIAPVHTVLFNFCLLQKWVISIVNAIQNHRESFGSSSHVIIHSFSSAGTLMVCAMNSLITNNEQYDSMQSTLYYDGIIYDSPHLGPLSIKSAILVLWELVKLNLFPFLTCCDIANNSYHNMCGCFYIWCEIWYYVLYVMVLILFLILLPVVMVLWGIYLLITCSIDYVCCHDNKLLGKDNIRILSVPMLLLGSDEDHINPIKKSMQFIDRKMDEMHQYKQMRHIVVDDGDAKEDTQLLSVGGHHVSNDKEYDSQYIKDIHRYFVFDNSEHVKHYAKYPKEYQRELNNFLDLCLKIDK